MKLVEINWHPTHRQLRQFGLICMFALPLVGWFWDAGPWLLGVLALLGLVFAVCGVTLPKVLKPIFLVLTIVATPIGWIVGELSMLLVFFGVFVPIGLIFRLTRRDALQLKIDRKKMSYWQPKKPPNGVASYYRQS